MGALRVKLTKSDRKNIAERPAHIQVVGERYGPEMIALVQDLRMSCGARHVTMTFAKSRFASRKYTKVIAKYSAAGQPQEKYFSTAIGQCFSSSIFGSVK